MDSSYYEKEMSFGFSSEGVTYMVRALILTTIAAFVVQTLAIIPPGGMKFIHEFVAFNLDSVTRGMVWQPFTYIFLHGGLLHLFFNMLWLFFFGPTVERILGSRQFLLFYLLCGVGGVLLNGYRLFLDASVGNVVVLGASGAAMGVLAAFATIDPDRKMFLFPLPFPITVRGVVIIIIAYNILLAASGDSGTSIATHFGGLAVGWGYMKMRPRIAQIQLQRRIRRAKPGEPPPKNEEDMGKAIDNIFQLHNRNRDKK